MNRALVNVLLKQKPAILGRNLKSASFKIKPSSVFNKIQAKTYYAAPMCTAPLYQPLSGIEKAAWFMAYYFIVVSYPCWVMYYADYYIDKGTGGRREMPDVE